MKEFLLTLVFILAAFFGAKAQTVQDVDALNFKAQIDKGNCLLLDVRTPGEYSTGHIAGSTNINIADPEFASKIKLLDKSKTLLVYCLSGSRSDAAGQYMSRLGFQKIYTLQRGLINWNRAGLPLETSGRAVASSAATYTDQAFNQLLKDNKLVLVDFNATWCAPCKAMIPVVDKISTDFKGKAHVAMVDVEANKAIFNSLQIQSIPGFVLFKDGKKVWTYNGIISYADLSGVIKKYL
jgi:thioredoxin